jgi:outer membrane protein OmpA-like peptidoglycan-associated protein
MRVKASCTLFLLTTLLATSNASAQNQANGFALNRFDPADRGSEWFALDSLDLRGHMRPAVGFVGDWSHKPLVVLNTDGSERAAIVSDQIWIHLGGSIVLWDRLRAGLDLPAAVYQNGDAVTLNGKTYSPPDSAFGDIRISTDLRLLGAYGDVFNSAIGFALYLPTGDRANYTSDNTVRFSPRATVAGDISMFTYSGRLGFNFRPLKDTFETNPLGSELTIGAAAGLRVLEKKLVVGPEIYGSTVTSDGSFFKKRTTPLEYLLGAHYTYKETRFGGGIGGGLTSGWGTPVVRIVLGAEWAPGADKDSDGDGILDKEDACPNVPGIRTNDPRTNGCPPAPPPPPTPDRDGDGIFDKDDACPDIPGVRSDDPKKNGCPPDRDGDGIYDKDDACPDVAGVANADPTKNGCPPDRDGDGIPDAVDACPDVPGVKSDDPKKNGCPSDRDGDGIYDKDDACPDAPGPADPDPKKNGCPLARIEQGQIRIIEQVKFKYNSSELERVSDTVLVAVATIMREHPEITKVRVEGHTDNRGNPVYNKTLSEARAASVMRWLSGPGKIDKKRLEAKGWGLEKPIDTNDTDEGRANNRRVEFHIDDSGGAAPPPAPTK